MRTQSQIRKAIRSFFSTQAKRRDMLQNLLVESLEHCVEHGDTSLLSEIIIQSHEIKSQDTNAIQEWLYQGGNFRSVADKETGKLIIKVKGKVGDIDMDLFRNTNWYDFKPVRNPATFNPENRFESLFNQLMDKGGMDMDGAIAFIKSKLVEKEIAKELVA